MGRDSAARARSKDRLLRGADGPCGRLEKLFGAKEMFAREVSVQVLDTSTVRSRLRGAEDLAADVRGDLSPNTMLGIHVTAPENVGDITRTGLEQRSARPAEVGTIRDHSVYAWPRLDRDDLSWVMQPPPVGLVAVEYPIGGTYIGSIDGWDALVSGEVDADAYRQRWVLQAQEYLECRLEDADGDPERAFEGLTGVNWSGEVYGGP
jgi:hypothetical protein